MSLIRGGAGVRSALRCYSVVAASQSTASTSASVSSSSSSWKLPIAPGTEPAYDEALQYISSQQARLKQKMADLQIEVQKYQPNTIERQIAEAKLKSYSIASQINDPEVRWEFENNVNAPLSNPVFAHLREKKWRDTRLPRLMERIRLMKVLPDAISYITPTVDLQVSFGEGKGFDDHTRRTLNQSNQEGQDEDSHSESRLEKQGGDVLAGCFVGAENTVHSPTITATPSHVEERLYTLAMVDLDYPYELEQRLGTFAHWLVHNIPLSLTKAYVEADQGDLVLPYIAPHPAKGTDLHRYTIVLFQQTDRVNNISPLERDHFSLHSLAEDLSLTPAGIHFWRSRWTQFGKDSISNVYRNSLQQDEPTFA